jgi:hypothetical protein
MQAWFRELPEAILDVLTPEQVADCQNEEDCIALLKLLPPMKASLLDWAVNLMTDVTQEKHMNMMNARNIAMVFAPNMTQVCSFFPEVQTAMFKCHLQPHNFVQDLIILYSFVEVLS